MSICNGIFTGTRGSPSLDTLMSMLSGLGSGGALGVPATSNGECRLLLQNVHAYILIFISWFVTIKDDLISAPPEELYATQLTQLREMGFIDTAENIQALVATAGNVKAAVERLLGNLGQ